MQADERRPLPTSKRGPALRLKPILAAREPENWNPGFRH